MDGPVRILQVDDDPQFAEVVAELLASHSDHFDVEIESDPAAVPGRLASDTFDCVVSDYQMPGVDGLQLLDRVRTRYPDLPFVLFTGKGSEEIASDAIAAGVTDYVRKGTGTERVAILANRIENAVEQHRAQQRLSDQTRSLRRKDRVLEAILEHVPVHVYVKDEQARHTWVSDYGFGSPALVGQTDAEYFDAEWAEETTREELEIIETGEPIVDQERYDPERDIWVRNTKVPWRDEDGEVTGVVGATWDVTEREDAKRECDRYHWLVEGLRTAVSHELRNPLQLAAGRLELVTEDCNSEHLSTVLQAHRDLEARIETTVTLAEAGEPVDETSTIDVETLARESWDRLDTAGTLAVDGDPTIEAEAKRLEQLLEELLENAEVHGGPEPTVTVRETAAGFAVTDEGPGPPAGEHDRLFDVGYTTEADRHGYGLAIARTIAEAHGWSIDIDDSGGETRVDVRTQARE
ncbi:response regulator [Halorhabdus sp. CBA1104]|uniref:response regulator n=1 Tax=Halorhabdus sp. CBA1104 TaxID=1380432 RepID=UPI0012B40B17|nr:response regulator [Halorhabdus sp. CBA1104]QGN07791.1 response regulator [Halorhabdus sp. CBA1104]